MIEFEVPHHQAPAPLRLLSFAVSISNVVEILPEIFPTRQIDSSSLYWTESIMISGNREIMRHRYDLRRLIINQAVQIIDNLPKLNNL
jgi:hypothetical protein